MIHIWKAVFIPGKLNLTNRPSKINSAKLFKLIPEYLTERSTPGTY